MSWFEFAAPVAVGVALVLSGVSKLRDPSGFVIGVLNYQILPAGVARIFARVLPFVEVALGLSLLVGAWLFISGLAAAALFSTFVIAVGVNLARRRAIDCHCFGSNGHETIGSFVVARLLVLLGCAVVVIYAQRAPLTAPEPIANVLVASGLLLGMQLVAHVPTSIRSLRAPAIAAPTRHGARVSFKNVPLQPISVLVSNRTEETSRCGACP